MAKVGRASRNSSLMRVETITGTSKSIAAAESGELYIVRATGGCAITLPPVKEGAYLKFLIGDDTGSGGDITIQGNSTAHYIAGYVGVLKVGANGGTVGVVAGQAYAATGDVLTITDGAGIKEGSWLEFVSDGTQWFVNGLIYGADANVAVGIA